MISVEDLYALYKKCSGLTTDSRKIEDGSMFFALKGDRFDGNDFAEAALKAGAKYAVVDRFLLEGTSYKGRECIVVENALDMLQRLAAYHRSLFDIPVLGITGTNGKTTTKELVSSVLSKKYKVVATRGNFNNQIGVPLTLLRIDEKTEIAIVEMGASAPGEIASLVKIVQPTCGLITSIGKAHLQGFGSLEGVKKAKGELYDFLRQKGGTVFYNMDNEHIREMVSRRAGLVARKYGVRSQGVKIVPATAENPYLTLEIMQEEKPVQIFTKLVGDYNAENVMAAITVGEYFEIPLQNCRKGIESYSPSNSRSQKVKTKLNTLIVDAYNANPSSMRAALDNFAKIAFEKKVMMLGDMLELGEDSAAEHKAILQQALEIDGKIFLVGDEFGKAAEALGCSHAVQSFQEISQLREYVSAHPIEGATILIKGSNGKHMQEVVPAL